MLDVTLPGRSGLDLQPQLAGRPDMPINSITWYGDLPMTLRAMKAGAVDVLTKPFNDDVLREAIQGAIERSRTGRKFDSALQTLRICYEVLTQCERERWRWSSPGC